MCPPMRSRESLEKIFWKMGDLYFQIWDQNRLFSKFELTPGGSALWQRIRKSPKKWSKPGSESESAPGPSPPEPWFSQFLERPRKCPILNPRISKYPLQTFFWKTTHVHMVHEISKYDPSSTLAEKRQKVVEKGPKVPFLSLFDPFLTSFLAHFSVRGHHPDPPGVSSNFENSQFWSHISESSNPPLFN